jgi:hypothetical protein
MGQSRYVHLDNCDVIAETDAALLVVYEGEEIWLPKSQVADPDDYEPGDESVTISVTEWVADQKGIDY